MKPHHTLVCQWVADIDCMAFCTWEKANFLCEIHAKQIVCIKKTCEFAYKNRLYFHQYRKKQWICSFFFMSIFLLAVQPAPKRWRNTVFWEKWSLEILIFSFGIGKHSCLCFSCKIYVKSGFSSYRRTVQFWFLLEGLFAAKCQKV